VIIVLWLVCPRILYFTQYRDKISYHKILRTKGNDWSVVYSYRGLTCRYIHKTLGRRDTYEIERTLIIEYLIVWKILMNICVLLKLIKSLIFLKNMSFLELQVPSF